MNGSSGPLKLNPADTAALGEPYLRRGYQAAPAGLCQLRTALCGARRERQHRELQQVGGQTIVRKAMQCMRVLRVLLDTRVAPCPDGLSDKVTL